MARTTKLYASSREQAVQMLASETPEPQLIQLYMCELDIQQHSRRKDFTPLLNDAEMEHLYRRIAKAGRGRVVGLLNSRRNVMRAAEELEQIKWRIIGKWNLIFSDLQQLEAIETMEAAINMALLAIPEPDRSNKAQQIANSIALIGCTQYVENGLIKITQEDIETDGNYISNKVEDIQNEVRTMFAAYKGCNAATMDYVKKKKLNSLLPVSLKMLGEYEDEVANYAESQGWGKYKDMPISLQKIEYDRKPTLQGLYNILPAYNTIELNKEGYQYMCETYFTD